MQLSSIGTDTSSHPLLQKCQTLNDRAMKASLSWAVTEILNRKHLVSDNKAGRQSRQTLSVIYENFLVGKKDEEHGLSTVLIDRVKDVLAENTESTGGEPTRGTEGEGGGTKRQPTSSRRAAGTAAKKAKQDTDTPAETESKKTDAKTGTQGAQGKHAQVADDASQAPNPVVERSADQGIAEAKQDPDTPADVVTESRKTDAKTGKHGAKGKQAQAADDASQAPDGVVESEDSELNDVE